MQTRQKHLPFNIPFKKNFFFLCKSNFIWSGQKLAQTRDGNLVVTNTLPYTVWFLYHAVNNANPTSGWVDWKDI